MLAADDDDDDDDDDADDDDDDGVDVEFVPFTAVPLDATRVKGAAMMRMKSWPAESLPVT